MLVQPNLKNLIKFSTRCTLGPCLKVATSSCSQPILQIQSRSQPQTLLVSPLSYSRVHIGNSNTVNVRKPNVGILALLEIVRFPNSSAFEQRLKNEPFGSVIGRSVGYPHSVQFDFLTSRDHFIYNFFIYKMV